MQVISNMVYLICILLSLGFTNGLYFELSGFENLKFVEDVPKSIAVLGNYSCEMRKRGYDVTKISSPGTCFNVQVYDPTGRLILSRYYGEKGKFSFQSHAAGEHTIVVSPLKEFKHDDVIRIHLNIASGEESLDFQKIKKREHLNSIEMIFRQLVKQVKDIQKEQDYERNRESVYRRISEKISFTTTAFAGGQICILIIVIAIQTMHLKYFFKQKKLV